MAARRLALGDRAPGQPEPEDLTTGERQNLSSLLGVKGRKEKRKEHDKMKKSLKPHGGRPPKKGGRGSGAGVVEVDLNDDARSD